MLKGCDGNEIKKLPVVNNLQVDAIRNILEGDLAVPIVQGQGKDKAKSSAANETRIISEIETLVEHYMIQQEVPFQSDGDEK